MKPFLKNEKSGFTPHITPIRLLFRKFISGRLCGGFTIVELLVAMSIFVILITIATGAFIQALRSERRLVALMSVSNNVGLVLEQMAREIRTGYNFTLPNLPNVETLSFSSTASAGGITYSRVGGKIQRNGQNVTADNVSVTKLDFIVSQESNNSCNPWRVTIVTTVNAFPAVTDVNDITLQTTASSRILPREVPRTEKTADIQTCK
ncbi:type II secretion system protein [bacterium]|nr:MAG: type II secretion system protein [bacterium]